MAKKLLKKSYYLKNLKATPYDNLWGSKGVFTTIRILGCPPKFIFFDDHILNLNKFLKSTKVNFVLNAKNLNTLFIDESLLQSLITHRGK